MEDYVLGVDLGTSSIKVSCVNKKGQVVLQKSEGYEVIHTQPGYCEQNPSDWVNSSVSCIRSIVKELKSSKQIVGISFAGQMHSLVILDKSLHPLRPAILWNDTRTTEECNEINNSELGKKLPRITGNKAVEGFTLPKLLWLKKHEPNNFNNIYKFLLPKDYVRYCITGTINIDYSDATGTIMMDINKKCWSKEIIDYFNLSQNIFPELCKSTKMVGYPTEQFCKETGLNKNTKIFAGCGDNAAGAIGAGILDNENVICSIGTSGVILAFEESPKKDYAGILQMECHSVLNKYYSMGVTLSAGDSLNWFRKIFAPNMSFNQLVEKAQKSPVGAGGVMFTPYINGERTPYTNSSIAGSFLGIRSNTVFGDFTRAVIEGITFSLNDILEIYLKNDKTINRIISIGGGAKSIFWLQIQADIFNRDITVLRNEQGPGIGAAMVAAMGCSWFSSWHNCIKAFVAYKGLIEPNSSAVKKYKELYKVYKQIYKDTQQISKKLKEINK